MGSAVLGEAISAIRDWSLTKDKNGSAPGKSETFGSLVFSEAVQEKRLPKAAYQALRRTIAHGEALDASVADAVAAALEGLGGRARRDALHALVPAADRDHGGEARFVSEPDGERQGGGGILRQGTGQGRARRLELPVGRHAHAPSRRAATRRGTRPARRGC